MSFNCDVCNDEVSYSSPCFTLRNNAEIVICNRCINKEIKYMFKQEYKPEVVDD